ncbi:hypothetical protein FSP39_025523 [Pinctada imbricata]|uniref:C-type lectin domain-containing protein n=1 Tax=Pinctada imbricata TaxID=66713 RepID=A0AA89C9F7_PINIB|nr:hypothetical protein FSP39_025523 [Pinctada imbricata]
MNILDLSTAWIGGNDIESEGTWKWTNSNTVFWSTNDVPANAYYTWYNGRPNDALGNNKDCLIIFGGKWYDRSCSYRFRKGICEKNN